jgi:hypothetical protein
MLKDGDFSHVELMMGTNQDEGTERGKIRLIESNAECRYLKKLTCKGTLRQVLICLSRPAK